MLLYKRMSCEVVVVFDRLVADRSRRRSGSSSEEPVDEGSSPGFGATSYAPAATGREKPSDS